MISTFSVPVDIPWQRIAFSRDMIDKVACDRELPPRWRPSLAIFQYEPPEEQQLLDGFKVTYLKVACTVTGFQADGKEIRIRERLGRAGWTWAPVARDGIREFLTDTVDEYLACYGAILEVVVAPPEGAEVALADYPYFADFDPKNRELYEQVTDTGEVMSRSLEDVGVRLGQTTTQSREVRDSTSVGLVAGYGGVGGSVSHESSTADINQQSHEDIRTTDAARESRETLSHITQLTQMYHQLTSYHLGTNRAAFFMLPRPHIVQAEDKDGTPRTFVDGPRQLEGIQEVMLVVVRPADQARICVEAYLETAHLSRTPRYQEGTTVNLVLPKISPPVPGAFSGGAVIQIQGKTVIWSNPQSGSAMYPADGAKVVIDTSRGDGVDAATGAVGGYHVVALNKMHDAQCAFDVAPGSVTVRGTATSKSTFNVNNLRSVDEAASVDAVAEVYLKSSAIIGYDDALMIIGRSVCSCEPRRPDAAGIDTGVVFERALHTAAEPGGRERGAVTIQQANRLGADVNRQLLRSLSSADRYPRATVDLLDTQFVAEAIAAHLSDDDRSANPRVAEMTGVDTRVRDAVIAYRPSITRAQLLRMPLAEQVENFGLSFAEVVGLRRALTGLHGDLGPVPVQAPSDVTVPLLTGMSLPDTLAAVRDAGLVVGEVTEVDSPLPAGSVTLQRPAAAAVVAEGTEVAVTLASGSRVRLPEVLGLGLADAACRLRDAGLRAEPEVHGRPGRDSSVTSLDPPAGTLVTPGAVVTMVLQPRMPGRA